MTETFFMIDNRFFSFLFFFSVCQLGFFNSNLLIEHRSCVHNITDATVLQVYSCIYCPLTSDNIEKLRLHVATKHPGEIPQIYDRKGQVHKTEVQQQIVLDIIFIFRNEIIIHELIFFFLFFLSSYFIRIA